MRWVGVSLALMKPWVGGGTIPPGRWSLDGMIWYRYVLNLVNTSVRSTSLNQAGIPCQLRVSKNARLFHPAAYKDLSYRFCCDVSNRNGFRPPRKLIDAGEHVSESMGRRKWANIINVYHVKSCISGGKGLKGCYDMTMDFWLLAPDARLDPIVKWLCWYLAKRIWMLVIVV